MYNTITIYYNIIVYDPLKKKYILGSPLYYIYGLNGRYYNNSNISDDIYADNLILLYIIITVLVVDFYPG